MVPVVHGHSDSAADASCSSKSRLVFCRFACPPYRSSLSASPALCFSHLISLKSCKCGKAIFKHVLRPCCVCVCSANEAEDKSALYVVSNRERLSNGFR